MRQTASISFNKEAKRVITSRNKTLVKMEAALALWIADCRKKNVSLHTNMFRTKAKNLYYTFVAPAGSDNDGDEQDDIDISPRKEC